MDHKPISPQNRTSGLSAVHSPRVIRSSGKVSSKISPEGEQRQSLWTPPRKVVKLAESVVFGNNRIHFDDDSTPLDKTDVVIGQARHTVGQLSWLTLLSLKITKAINYIKTGKYELQGETFVRSLKAFESINLVTNGLLFLRASGEAIYNTAGDIAAGRKRSEAGKLLQSYQPDKRHFHSRYQRDRLKKLMEYKHSDVSRGRKRVAMDRLVQLSKLTERAMETALSSLLVANPAGRAASQAIPGLGIALSAIGTLFSALQSASQINALNNLASAEAATSDPILLALAGHIRQQRTFTARQHLVQTAVGVAMTGVTIGLTASAAGAPAAFIAAGSVTGAVTIGNAALEAWHNRQIAKQRASAEMLGRSARSLESIAQENIGIAEAVLLNRLRTYRGQKLEKTVTFLLQLGLDQDTIKKLQLAPKEMATKTLQKSLYQNKVHFRGPQLRQTMKTTSHLLGISAAARRIKVGSLWLSGRLSPSVVGTSDKKIGNNLHTPADHPIQKKEMTPIHSPRVRHPTLQQRLYTKQPAGE